MAGPTPVDPQKAQQLLQQALRGPVPRFHANGAMIAQSASDMVLVMLSNGVPVTGVSISYETAKHVAKELDKAVKKFEAATGTPVSDMHEVQPKLQKIMEAENATSLND